MPGKFAALVNWIGRTEVQLTGLYCMGFFGLGLVLAGFGPAVPDLRDLTGTTATEQARVISIRAAGYLVGSGVGGPLFDKYPGNLLLAGALSACAVGTFLVPLVTSIWLEGAFVILQGVAMGFLDTGGNVMTLFIWGKDAEPYMQGLHFMFGFGGFLAPLLLKFSHFLNWGLKGAWWAMAAVFIPTAIGLVRFSSPKNPHSSDSAPAKPFSKYELMIIGLTALFLAAYVGTEVATGSLIVTFVAERNVTSLDEAYLVNSAFWGSLSVFRLIAIPTSIYLSPAQMLLINTTVSTGISIVLWIFSTSRVVWWISMLVFGAAMASSFPTAVTLAERYIKVTGKAASLFVVGASLGELAIPAGIGALLEPTNYMSVIYGMAIFSFVQLLALGGLWMKGDPARRDEPELDVETPKEPELTVELEPEERPNAKNEDSTPNVVVNDAAEQNDPDLEVVALDDVTKPNRDQISLQEEIY